MSSIDGAEAVARAEPDGYVLGGFNDSNMTMVPHLLSKKVLGYPAEFRAGVTCRKIEWG